MIVVVIGYTAGTQNKEGTKQNRLEALFLHSWIPDFDCYCCRVDKNIPFFRDTLLE